uniref:Uncharacterized protein n=1 Tax=Anguilla anguilla TaxID=7936 RepID=A0A0E9URX4_ANGAN
MTVQNQRIFQDC